MTAGGAVARNRMLPKPREVFLARAVKKPSTNKMHGADILKEPCGVRHYDLDFQELSAVADEFPKATVEEILRQLSYSSTFLEAATQTAAEKSIKHAYWALAQYDFVYKPRPGRKVDERAPFFLGVF